MLQPNASTTPHPATRGCTHRYVTLKVLGYESPEAYYRAACCTNYIPHIATPCLYLLARDDPFLG